MIDINPCNRCPTGECACTCKIFCDMCYCDCYLEEEEEWMMEVNGIKMLIGRWEEIVKSVDRGENPQQILKKYALVVGENRW